MKLLEAYITNLGKFVEGQIVAEPLTFPTTKEAVQSLLKEIQVDGVHYEEVLITSYESDIHGLSNHLGEYEHIDELNYLTYLLSELDQEDLKKFEAAIDSGEYSGSVKNLINLTQNLDLYELYPRINDTEALGKMYLQEFQVIDVPEQLIDYMDYDAYGQDIYINEGGSFTHGGYVVCLPGKFTEYYQGFKDIPLEHRVFSIPSPSVREQLKTYQNAKNSHSMSFNRMTRKKDKRGR